MKRSFKSYYWMNSVCLSENSLPLGGWLAGLNPVHKCLVNCFEVSLSTIEIISGWNWLAICNWNNRRTCLLKVKSLLGKSKLGWICLQVCGLVLVMLWQDRADLEVWSVHLSCKLRSILLDAHHVLGRFNSSILIDCHGNSLHLVFGGKTSKVDVWLCKFVLVGIRFHISSMVLFHESLLCLCLVVNLLPKVDRV